MTAPHGWIVLDKPPGLGSTQAVGAVKRNLREAGLPRVKVGHGGTLDPLAEGVLPIALGEATKLAGRMLDASKTYEFTISFGEETDTLDAEGEVIARSERLPPRAAVAGVLDHFTGEIEQLPPAYSALKVDGRRAYDRARAGEDVELKLRRVTIHSLELAGGYEARPLLDSAFATTSGRPDPYDPSAPLELAESATLVAKVSKGTYIRALARDISHALGTLGHVTMLRRTQAGPFDQSQVISLDKLNDIGKGAPIERILLPLEAGLDDIPAIDLGPEQAGAVRQGRVLTGLSLKDGLFWARSGTVPVALMELAGGEARVVRGFNLPDVAE
ncbi:tRNA pseudouridine synthase B [Novosphingobium marinum]|uniref:tRNA pseudouridine synthase B n=1 Tax=Novosphingobium marinum TaxID=1514948 RepID=A0A7Z0BVL3_9SPHN|nr:tRNA pseudouridine(55) synthase TruB [Novosphingobium marinum]NYH95465.1 tRNA pseudouridine55 synthase [Novosphingobium marinum]GGC27303.1 tRNA pseudouridine synthase B [Novosphingobium marinum]